MSAVMNTGQLMLALRTCYTAKACAFFEQVRDGAGHGGTRWADAMAMGLWPSRGLHLIGFEVKASRSDWQRELKNPAKAEECCRYCDRWYIVAGHDQIVREGELPATWGLLLPHGSDGLREAVKAPVLDPVPMDRGFLAALLRRAAEWRPGHQVLQDMLDKERQGIRDDAIAGAAREFSRDLKELADLKVQLAEFEAASGIKIQQYGGAGRIGHLVKCLGVLRGDADRWTSLPAAVKREAAGFRQLADRIEEAAAKFEAAVGGADPGPQEGDDQ